MLCLRYLHDQDQVEPQAMLPNGCQLIQGDCTDPKTTAGQIADNSIELIFTDPSYNMGSIPLYGELGELAMRVLKPSGSLVTCFPQYALPEIPQHFLGSGLK